MINIQNRINSPQNYAKTLSFEGNHSIANILKEYTEQGLSPTEIGQKLGINRQKVWRIMTQLGIKTVNALEREKRNKQFIELYKQGLTVDKISEKSGARKKTVTRFFKENHYPTPKHSRHIGNIQDPVLRKIAKSLKLTKEFIAKNLK